MTTGHDDHPTSPPDDTDGGLSAPAPQLVDQFNRHLNYLRISVTDRCNLACIYCSPGDGLARLSHEDILRYEELLRLVTIAADLGIVKIRVTGGEPLVRKGVCHFLSRLAQIDGVGEVTLTTNGVLLKDNIRQIWSSGIRRVNISLDTLDREKFKRITRRDCFQQVWDGIQAALEMGFAPIKLNVVALRGINEDELVDFARLAMDYPFHIRFIEHMPIGAQQMQSAPPLLVPEIKERLQIIGDLLPVAHDANDGPAERYQFENARGEIGFISALSHHFCQTCNRLRLTASGQLRPCLLSDHQLDLKTPLRSGATDARIAALFRSAVLNKPANHRLSASDHAGVSCQMSTIGG